MNKKILRIQRKSNKIIALFVKMIEKLVKQNDRLTEIIMKAQDEIEEQMNIQQEAEKVMIENNKQINKLESFIGKEDNNE